MNVLQLKRTAAVLLAVMTLCPRSPVRAEGDTVTTVNHIGTGNVSISLNEYRLSADGTETPIEGNSDRRTVLPGDTVSKISKITVNGHKSWIRAKVMTEGDSRITTLLVRSGLCKSQSDARKQIEQNAVSLAGEKVADPLASVSSDQIGSGLLLKKGKKGYCRIILK